MMKGKEILNSGCLGNIKRSGFCWGVFCLYLGKKKYLCGCKFLIKVVIMQLNYVYRQYDDYYVGHLIEFPEYDTQGKTIEELVISGG